MNNIFTTWKQTQSFYYHMEQQSKSSHWLPQWTLFLTSHWQPEHWLVYHTSAVTSITDCNQVYCVLKLKVCQKYKWNSRNPILVCGIHQGRETRKCRISTTTVLTGFKLTTPWLRGKHYPIPHYNRGSTSIVLCVHHRQYRHNVYIYIYIVEPDENYLYRPDSSLFPL